MKTFKANIERLTVNNNYYRKVLFTTKQMQLVLMAIPTGEEIGEEVHPDTTQFFHVESGTGVAHVSGKQYNLKDGDALVVPAGAHHNIRSTGDLRLYTIYTPPEHPPKRLQKEKID